MVANKGFTLIETVTAMLIISVIASSIMIGITSVEKKLFKIRLKERAFEELQIYTDFLASRIMIGDIPGDPPEEGYNIPIYQKTQQSETKNVYTAKINYDKIQLVSDPINNGQVYQLNTYILWPNESIIKDTLFLNTYQLRF